MVEEVLELFKTCPGTVGACLLELFIASGNRLEKSVKDLLVVVAIHVKDYTDSGDGVNRLQTAFLALAIFVADTGPAVSTLAAVAESAILSAHIGVILIAPAGNAPGNAAAIGELMLPRLAVKPLRHGERIMLHGCRRLAR